MSGRSPSRWSRKRAAKSALLPKRLMAMRFTSLMLLIPLRPINPIVHGVAEPAEHDKIQARR